VIRSPTMTVTILHAGIGGAQPDQIDRPDPVSHVISDHHDYLVRSAIVAAGGTVIESDDETLSAVFSTAPGALSAALDALRAHQKEAGSDADGFPMCIALHTGQVALQDDCYVESALRQAGRLLACGHGGQVLLSGETCSLVRECLPEGCSIRDLGSYQIGDDDRPERVYQLVAPGISGDLPSPTFTDTHHGAERTNLTQVPFVGRDSELHDLCDALDRAFTGNGQVALITGEPGIGKTWTAEQLVADARERRATVLWGNCFEWEGAPAYWPWAQVLRAWLREVGDDTLRAISGEQAALVSQIVPEIRERLPSLPAPPIMEPDARHFRLLTATGSIFRVAATHQPLVVVLDDIHWADSPSLQLLRFLAHEIRGSRLLLIATYRDTEVDRRHAASPILADLVRDPHCRRLSLQGLEKTQVARFVTLITGEEQPQSLIDAVYEETEGNPFFVTEVVRILVEDAQLGETIATPRRTRVPQSVREAVGRRIDRLTPECVNALTAASVIGTDFNLYLLERASRVPAPELLDTLDEAVRAHLITHGDEPATFRFTHILVKETLYQETSPGHRARIHLTVAEALENAVVPEPAWAELAHHFSAAIPLGDPDKVVTYAERAGHAAMVHFAWDVATAHYQRALSALPFTGSHDPARRCDLLLALGEAQNRSGPGSGDAPTARKNFLAAFELARDLDDGERMACAAVGYAGLNIVAAFGGSRQLELLEEALETLDPNDSPLRVRVLARLAVDLWHRSTDNLERARSLSDTAVAMAYRLGDATLIGYALWARHSSGYRPDNLDERESDSERLAALAEQTGDPTIATWGYLAQVGNCIEMGDLPRAEQAMVWLRQFDERVSIPFVAQRVSAFSAALDLLKGRYSDAVPHVERAQALWQSRAPRQHQFQPFLLWRDLGQLNQMAEDIRLPDHLHPWRQAALAHRLALALERGCQADARADYEALVTDDLARVPFTRHWLVTVTMLAEAAVAFKDEDRAATLIRLMEPYADRIAFDGPMVVAHGPVSLYLGQLAGVLGRWDDALRWLNQASATSERLGLRPYVARSQLAQAEVLVNRQGSGDLAAASNLAQRALDTVTAIGMHGLIPRANRLRDALPKQPDNPFRLTEREREVLNLVAQGLTDADVAERLFLSPRTVSTHLTSIYSKLDVSSRTAATRVASEHGLN
jgi:DNA-binding CsgD family transcriptional regulator/tetratricopeptide (TPR) repeat protein